MSKTKYKITLVPFGNLSRDTTTPSHGAQAPRYDRERDEPIFNSVWQKVAERKRLASEDASRRERNLFSPPPPEGFKLRGPRNRRLVGAEQSGLETMGDLGEKQ